MPRHLRVKQALHRSGSLKQAREGSGTDAEEVGQRPAQAGGVGQPRCRRSVEGLVDHIEQTCPNGSARLRPRGSRISNSTPCRRAQGKGGSTKKRMNCSTPPPPEVLLAAMLVGFHWLSSAFSTSFFRHSQLLRWLRTGALLCGALPIFQAQESKPPSHQDRLCLTYKVLLLPCPSFHATRVLVSAPFGSF